jgi:hypothetical protein
MPRALAAAVCLSFALAPHAGAVTSSPSIPSKFSGNGHNISFDGRLFLTRDHVGWRAYVLRPEATSYGPGGYPLATGAMWSDPRTILDTPDPEALAENALALCEPDAARAPYACDLDGQPGAGYDCYDLVVLDSDATAPLPSFRRRRLQVWVGAPRTASASVVKHVIGPTEELSAAGGPLRGIEPTVTADGKLLVWNGSLDNQLSADALMYAVNPAPCARDGWSAPRSLSRMVNDPLVNRTYRLADRALRSSDGRVFADGERVHGAYPWLMPSGDAVVFQAAQLPCRGVEDPPGCGPTRNALSVLGYPTNWGIAVVDGGANPDTDQTARLFFSSPGPATFPQLPVGEGRDVWPFFGSNTSNYVELSFDDGLDGGYAGLWHMNEGVTRTGQLDGAQAPDVSGYFNTARLGLSPPRRDLLGARDLPGSGAGATLAGHDATTSRLTVEMAVTLAASPDCDARNNWRVLAMRGDFSEGPWNLVLEEDGALVFRARVGAGEEYQVHSARRLEVGRTARIAASYDAGTGDLRVWIDGAPVAAQRFAPRPLIASTGEVTVGGPPEARPACPDGYGTLQGRLVDVDVGAEPPVLPGAGFPARNNGWLGKAVELDGRAGWLEVAHAASLSPSNAITMELRAWPASDPDCDDANNHRVLLRKGAYSLTLEETRGVRARVSVGGIEQALYSGATLPLGAWTHVLARWDGATGRFEIAFDGRVVAAETVAAGTLDADGEPLLIGGPGAARPACPDGGGAFHGSLDEVAVSRVFRVPAAAGADAGPAPGPDAAPAPPDAPAAPPVDAAPSPIDPGPGGGGGGGCAAGGGGAPSPWWLLIALPAVRRAGRRDRRRR